MLGSAAVDLPPYFSGFPIVANRNWFQRATLKGFRNAWPPPPSSARQAPAQITKSRCERVLFSIKRLFNIPILDCKCINELGIHSWIWDGSNILIHANIVFPKWSNANHTFHLVPSKYTFWVMRHNRIRVHTSGYFGAPKWLTPWIMNRCGSNVLENKTPRLTKLFLSSRHSGLESQQNRFEARKYICTFSTWLRLLRLHRLVAVARDMCWTASSRSVAKNEFTIRFL